MKTAIAIVVVVMFVLGCVEACTTSGIGLPCARRSDCATGFCTKDGYCAIPPVDAGTPEPEAQPPRDASDPFLDAQ